MWKKGKSMPVRIAWTTRHLGPQSCHLVVCWFIDPLGSYRPRVSEILLHWDGKLSPFRTSSKSGWATIHAHRHHLLPILPMRKQMLWIKTLLLTPKYFGSWYQIYPNSTVFNIYNHKYHWLVVYLPLWKILVSWDDSSQYMEK